jgi:hypothetical protein
MTGEHINIGERNIADKEDSVLSCGSDSDTVLVALAVKLDQTLRCPSPNSGGGLSEPPDIFHVFDCLDGQTDHMGVTVHVTNHCRALDRVVAGSADNADGGGVIQNGDELEVYGLLVEERGGLKVECVDDVVVDEEDADMQKVDTGQDRKGGHVLMEVGDTSSVSVQEVDGCSKLIGATESVGVPGIDMDEGSCFNLEVDEGSCCFNLEVEHSLEVDEHCTRRGRVIKAPGRFQDFILE